MRSCADPSSQVWGRAAMEVRDQLLRRPQALDPLLDTFCAPIEPKGADPRIQSVSLPLYRYTARAAIMFGLQAYHTALRELPESQCRESSKRFYERFEHDLPPERVTYSIFSDANPNFNPLMLPGRRDLYTLFRGSLAYAVGVLELAQRGERIDPGTLPINAAALQMRAVGIVRAVTRIFPEHHRLAQYLYHPRFDAEGLNQFIWMANKPIL